MWLNSTQLYICTIASLSKIFSVHLNVFQREIRQQLAEKAKAGELKVVNGAAASQPPSKRKRRWDQTADQTPGATPKKLSSWDQAEVIPLVFYYYSF